MAEHPAALQLRLLQTVVEVAAERNSTLVLPFPVELLRFLEHTTPPEPTRVAANGTVASVEQAPAEPPTPALVDAASDPAPLVPAQAPLPGVTDAHGFLAGQCG